MGEQMPPADDYKKLGPGIYIHDGRKFIDVVEFLEAEGIEPTDTQLGNARLAASHLGWTVLENGGRA